MTHTGNSSFWEAAIDGNQLVVRRGKTGARGQISLKTFPDAESAGKELDRQEKEQKQKGYQPV
jgi:predicted DNA-binding WGR domain protein